ncbi:hypothetical protein FUAX_55870 (plasmid) [Fulvitalea axinellae]|uniref:Uncharacterized protein n=1 Tax=Fulvitalea axinellae TaxID=1182444 RepID=A0AAU9DKW3_9BACT|nr:hypothetical protein FUAX_55870 [Fulvitalea axinellae]
MSSAKVEAVSVRAEPKTSERFRNTRIGAVSIRGTSVPDLDVVRNKPYFLALGLRQHRPEPEVKVGAPVFGEPEDWGMADFLNVPENPRAIGDNIGDASLEENPKISYAFTVSPVNGKLPEVNGKTVLTRYPEGVYFTGDYLVYRITLQHRYIDLNTAEIDVDYDGDGGELGFQLSDLRYLEEYGKMFGVFGYEFEHPPAVFREMYEDSFTDEQRTVLNNFMKNIPGFGDRTYPEIYELIKPEKKTYDPLTNTQSLIRDLFRSRLEPLRKIGKEPLYREAFSDPEPFPPITKFSSLNFYIGDSRSGLIRRLRMGPHYLFREPF